MSSRGFLFAGLLAIACADRTQLIVVVDTDVPTPSMLQEVEVSVTSADDEIVGAMRDLLGYAKLVPEPAGAAALAALLTGKITLDRGSRVAAIVSGGNVDLGRLKDLL